MRKAYLNSINYASCEAYLHDVRMALCKRHPYSVSERMTAPLAWWMRTGRASATFLKALFCIQPWRVARALEAYDITVPEQTVIDDCIKPMVKAKAHRMGLLG